MKFNFLIFFFFLLFSPILRAQQGMWTWMHGSSVPNSLGNYGVMGKAAPGNDPPGLYEPANWTDLSGKFWIFGGLNNFGPSSGSMWMFDPQTNNWTWMHGSSSGGTAGVYGIQGVPAAGNIPGARSFGSATWVDAAGNLWLFGGLGYDVNGASGMLSDLWKYTVATDMWTWVAGPNTINYGGSYGMMNVQSPSNAPPARYETNATWVDANGNLWLFGGAIATGTDAMNDLWKFDLSVNQWTWMHGSRFPNPSGNYGIKGLPGIANDPPGREAYSAFKDGSGNFWFFGGGEFTFPSANDLWKFDPVSAMWAWMKGSNISGDSGRVGSQCVLASSNNPSSRLENRACWTDACGNFYTMGGGNGNSFSETYNDLWYYNVTGNEWILVNGSGHVNPAGNWGVMTVPSASNEPSGRGGSVGFTDIKGNLWYFGGAGTGFGPKFNDLWKYVPDTNCINSHTCIVQSTLQSAFVSSSQKGCAPLQVFFTNQSLGAATYSWNFGDGTGSNASNTVHVYNSPGTYNVSLVVSNGTRSDSLIRMNCVAVDSCVVWDCGKLFVPNFFSPNNDGINDKLCVYGQCLESLSFSIFDRWGEKVFETTDQTVGWDGRYKGQMENAGVFMYSFNGTLTTGEKINKKGNITLMR